MQREPIVAVAEKPFEAAERPLAFGDELEALLAALPDDLDVGPDEALAVARTVFDDTIREVLAEMGHPVAAPTSGEPALAVALLVGTSTFTLEHGSTAVVGRRGDLIVDHPLVSRRHVAITAGRSGPTCVDLDSANGTWVERDGERTSIDSTPFGLSVGDVLVTVQGQHLVTIVGTER